MRKDPEAESRFDFYYEKLSPLADQFYHLSIFVCLDVHEAKNAVLAFYDKLAKKIEELEKEGYQQQPEVFLAHITKQLWEILKEVPAKSNLLDLPIAKTIGQLALLERAALAMLDFFDYPVDSVCEILAINTHKLDEVIASAREKICDLQLDRSKLDDKQKLFFFAKIADFQADELLEPEKNQFIDLFRLDQNRLLAESYKKAKGTLQVALQECHSDEMMQHVIRTKFQDDQTSFTRESEQIDSLSKQVFKSTLARRLLIAFSFIAAIGVGVFYWWPKKGASFDALNTLSYESVAMSKDVNNTRLSLPSNDENEIRDFIAQEPSLLKPKNLLKTTGWRADGASLIDYSIKKVAVVQYSKENSNLRIFLFYFEGNLSRLPQSELSHLGSLAFQSYANSQMNMIVWQENAKNLGMLSGTISVQNLAEIVVASRR